MSAVLTITRGLPGSGKSTWAKTQPAIRINRDTVRAAVSDQWPHGDVLSERLCTVAQHAMIRALLDLGQDVIADDTNLDDWTVGELARIADEAGADFVVHDLRHLPVELCVARDAGRTGTERVGAARIRQMASVAGLL